MRRINFDIKYRPEIESGRYKVQTRDGKPARVILWDALGPFPIIALVSFGDEEGPYSYTKDGKSSTYNMNSWGDLFILTDEPELTPFEEAVKQLMQIVSAYGSPDYVEDSDVKDRAKRLLDLAKKEILKDMPRWKKYGNGACGGGNFPIAICKVGCGYRLVESLVSGDEYIMLSDLEKLPKED